MKKANRSAIYVFGMRMTIAVVSGIAALLGYTIFSRFSLGVIAAIIVVAAGAILAMLADTMIPEAFEEAHDFARTNNGHRFLNGVRSVENRRMSDFLSESAAVKTN